MKLNALERIVSAKFSTLDKTNGKETNNQNTFAFVDKPKVF